MATKETLEQDTPTKDTRISIDLPEEVWRAAKVAAVLRGLSLKSFVTAALRSAIEH